MTHRDQSRDRPGDEMLRLTVAEAADRLGISEAGVRKRIQRGQIPHERGYDGRLFVWVSPGETSHAESRDRDSQSRDELVEELRDRVRYLERQVEEERGARFRADQLLARLMDRVPELEPPAPRETPEPREEPGPYRVRPERAEPAEPVDPRREEPEKVEPQRVEPERAEPGPTSEGAQEENQKRSGGTSLNLRPLRVRNVGEEMVSGALAQGAVAFIGTWVLPLVSAIVSWVFAILAALDSRTYVTVTLVCVGFLLILFPFKIAPMLERKLSERTYTFVATVVAVLLVAVLLIPLFAWRFMFFTLF